MAVNKPTGDNARKGAVKKRSQTKTTLAGASAWTKRGRVHGPQTAFKEKGGQEIQGRADRKEERDKTRRRQKHREEEDRAPLGDVPRTIAGAGLDRGVVNLGAAHPDETAGLCERGLFNGVKLLPKMRLN